MVSGKTAAVVLLLALGLTSCALAGRSVSYEIDYPDSVPLVVVPKVQPLYQKKLSPDPMALSNVRGKLLYNDPSPQNREILPEELVAEFDVYQNSVYLKTVTVVPTDYRRSEIQYPLYPVQVTYTYTLKLSAEDKLKLVNLPTAGIGTDSLTETSVRVFWSPVERNGQPVSGLPYRAVVTPLGATGGPVTLTDADLDRTSQTFTDLVPGTGYWIKVYYGGPAGHPGEYSSVTIKTPSPGPVVPSAPADLAAAQALLPGTWSGTMTCPWAPPTPVRWTIGSDGSYSAVSLLPSQSPALYYGTDADSPLKVIRLISSGLTGVSGSLVLYFHVGTTVTDSFSDLAVSQTKLTFSFLHLAQYGPVRFDLTRQ